jgi:extracellular elastinolytic metalloproteinase
MEGIDHPLRKRTAATTSDKVKSFFADRLKVDPATVKLRSGYKTDVVEHTYISQMHDGIPFANVVANVAFGLDGRVVSFGHNFVKPSRFEPCSSNVTLT